METREIREGKMKKLFVSLVVFATFSGAAFAAEPSISGGFSAHYVFPGNNSQKAAIGDLKFKVEIPVGEYVKFVMNISDASNTNNYFKIDNVSASTDISGALGIEPVSINLKAGRFAQGMGNSNSFTGGDRFGFVRGATNATGRSEAENKNKKVDVVNSLATASAPAKTGKTEYHFTRGGTADVGLDIGILNYATLLTYASFDDDQFQYRFGLKLGDVLKGLNFIVSYGGNKRNTDSYIKSDFGYELMLGDISITVPVNVRYVLKTPDKLKYYAKDKEATDALTKRIKELKASPAGVARDFALAIAEKALEAVPTDPMSGYKEKTFLWATGLKFSGFGAKFNVGIGSQKSSSSPSYLDFDLEYTIVGLTAYVRPHLSLIENDDALEFIDFGLNYTLSGNTFYLGYVLDTGDNKLHKGGKQDIATTAGGPKLKGGGLYIATKIKY